MSDFRRKIDEALLSEKHIPKQEVLSWIERTNDIRTLSKLYRLTRERYYQIQTDLGKEATCELIQRYLLQCIRENVVDDDLIEDRWEAAQALQVWFCQLSFWDSLIVAAAKAAACGFLLTEDLQDGQKLDGVEVVNPFLRGHASVI